MSRRPLLYYADFGRQLLRVLLRLDCIIDDQLWTPEDLEGAWRLFAWGPPPPPFLHPDDLAAMMTGAHAAAVMVPLAAVLCLVGVAQVPQPDPSPYLGARLGERDGGCGQGRPRPAGLANTRVGRT